MSLINLKKEQLHHTNICVGDRDIVIKDIKELVSVFSNKNKNKKISYVLYQYDKFLLDDAQYIFSTHIHKVSSDEMNIIGIAFNSTNLQSQNSILKILEEPPLNTYFFIIVPSKKIILPTVLSRSQIFEYKKEVDISKETLDFIKLTIPQRLEFIKKTVEEIKKEKKTKQDVINFIEEIEKYTHQQKNITLLKRTIEIKEYLKDPGASVKQLLEYLSLEI